MHAFVVAWVVAASAVGSMLTVRDKHQARAGRRRVRERTLLAWAFIGGWPGMALAMPIVRHKTRKAAFLLPFLVCASANGVLLWLLLRRPPAWL